MVELGEFKSRYEAVKAVEKDKDKIIEDLMDEVKRLQDALYHEKDEMENQRTLVRAIKLEAKEYQSKIEKMSRDQAKLSFVSVLVDGDCMNFNDNFVQDGYNGGRSAARLLIENVERYVQYLHQKESSNVQYRIRVYANVPGLAKTYRETNTISEDGTLLSFIQGFNMEDVMCDFVDAGDGKECSDVKIGAQFKQDIIDVHCLHVVFCASADNGYARVLGPHRSSKTSRNKITLVEGPPFAREIRELAPAFATTSFPEVFRLQKLNRRVSFSNVPTTPMDTSTPVSNYASIVRAATSRPRQDETPPSASTPISGPNPIPTGPSIKCRSKLAVCKNANDQRVDSPLQISTRAKVEALKQQKFCNQYHILGSCSYGEACTHKHNRRLVDQDVIDLMYIARLSVCSRGLLCEDKSCTSGHRCPQRGCLGPAYGCKFGEDMHGVNTKIVASV